MYISNFIEISIPPKPKPKTLVSKSVLDQLVEDIASPECLTTLCSLPKSIKDEFPGGVINMGVYAGDGRIVDPIYPVIPRVTIEID